MNVKRISPAVLGLLALLSPAVYAQDAAAIQKRLETEYPLTKANYDKTDIVTAGSVVVLQKDKVLMLAASSTNPCRNTYKDGQVKQSGPCAANEKLKKFSKFTSHIPGAASTPDSPASHTFVSGEKFWVTKIEVRDTGKEPGIVFSFFTDAINDQRYATTLLIPFNDSTPSPDEAVKLAQQVITVAPSEDAKGDDKKQPAQGGQQQAGQPQTGTPAADSAPPAEAAPPAKEAAPAPIEAPPPPPPDPAEIKEGQTVDEVVAALGQPVKKAKVGAKEIYYYKDLKVTFVSGKVKDIQ